MGIKSETRMCGAGGRGERRFDQARRAGGGL